MSHFEVDPFDAPPLPAWSHGTAQARPATTSELAHAAAVTIDTFEDIDPEDAPTLPSRARRSLPRPADRVAAEVAPSATPHRVVAPIADSQAQDDWLLVAIGLGVACSMLTLLMMLFTGWGA